MNRRIEGTALILAIVGTVGFAPAPAAGPAVEFSAGGTVIDWTVEPIGDRSRLLVLVRPNLDGSDGPGDARPEDSDREPVPPPLPPCPGATASDVPLELWSVDPRNGDAVRVRADLPAGGRTIRVVGREASWGPLRVLDGDGGRTILGERRSEDRIALGGGGIRDLPDDRVARVGIGRMAIAAPDDGGTWREIGVAELPVDVEVGRRGATIATAAPRVVGRGESGEWILATPPRAVGTRRVRVRIDRVGADGGVVTEDCWARLPEDEDLLESWVVAVDGVPWMVTTTKEAGKLALFGEKRLRVHRLVADRSRLGDPPVLAVESRMNLWQSARLTARDVDGDGRTDLALAYWKGLKDDRVVVDVYRALEDGGFSRRPRSTGFDVEDGHRGWAAFGDDLDGDGRPDLLIRAGADLVLHRGKPWSRRGALVERDGHALSLPEGLEPPSGAIVMSVGGRSEFETTTTDAVPGIRDVDGDGAVELVVVGRRDGSDVLVVLEVLAVEAPPEG